MTEIVSSLDFGSLRKFTISTPLRLLMVYIPSLIIYLICYLLPQFIPILILRSITGIFSFLLFPGLLLSQYLPSALRKDGISIALGLMLIIIEIQILFNLMLIVDLPIPLFIWISLINSITVLVLLIGLRTRLSEEIEIFPLSVSGRWVFGIFALGLSLRIIMMFFGQNCISPDTALYADFAMGMLDGEFSSNIFNDGAIQSLWGGVQLIRHQGTVYLYAFSWLIFPPDLSGPIFVLLLAGILMIFSGMIIARKIFNEKAAKWTGTILAIHPLFVFHSVVGYGPEIFSLLFFSISFILFIEGFRKNSLALFFGGLMIGFIDLIWYPTFYIVCLVFPFLFGHFAKMNRKEMGFSFVSMILILATRLLFPNLTVLIISWPIIFVGAYIIKRMNSIDEGKDNGLITFFVGVFLALMSWRLALYISPGPPGSQTSSSALNQIQDALFSSVGLNTVESFFSFLLFHLSPIIALFLVGFIFTKYRKNAIVLILSSIVCLGGTLLVLAVIPESLQPIYLYSDSRFFLLSVFFLVISASVFVSRITTTSYFQINTTFLNSLNWQTKHTSVIVFALLLLGLTPGYLAIPSGLNLIKIEERYGWDGLPDIINELPIENARFLIDRAREFSWLTHKESVRLILPGENLSDNESANYIVHLMKQFEADYLVIDHYTIAKWGTLEWLYNDPMDVGTTVLFDFSVINHISGTHEIESANSLRLVAENEEDNYGNMFRIFEICNSTFYKTLDIQFLESGWGAGNGGTLTNVSGVAELEIGDEENYTYTWRISGPDLNLSINSGFLYFELENTSSSIARISIWDGAGSFIRYATPLANGIYYSSFSQVEIGDIRIVIEGESGGLLQINELSVWEEGYPP